MRSSFVLSGALFTAIFAGCTAPNNRPPASVTNRIDTVTISALSGTPVYEPSGYSMTERKAVRLDQSSTADLAYDVTPSGRHVMLPAGLIGQGSTSYAPGLKPVDLPFDSLTTAVTDGYLTLDTVTVEPGGVYYTRSRIPPNCYLGLPAYGKLEVLSFDDAKRTVLFRVLVNLNCGYMSLEPGLPTR